MRHLTNWPRISLMLLVLMSTTVSAALGAPGVLSLREAARLSDEREQAEKAAQLAAESC